MPLPRFGITAKLFCALVAVCAVMALGMSVATRISFQAGFLDYLGELEQERLTALASELADGYAEHGNSWAYLGDSPRDWRRLVGRFLRRDPEPRGREDEKAAADRARRGWETAHLRSSLGLVAADGETLVAGVRPGPGALRMPVSLDNGGTVGWLTRMPLSGITEAIDLRFQEQQRKSALIIAGLSLLLAAAVSVCAARLFLAPLRRLAEVTGRLTEGDLEARVDLQTGDELHTLADQLNQLAGALQRNEQTRRAFMAEISHDLRTPLSILRGEIEALQDGVRPLTRESLASLHAEVDILSRLVDDIHTLSLADVGALSCTLAPLDLTACLRSVLDSCKDRIAARSLTLEAHLAETPPVRADAGRITQVLLNLLENSLRYTDPGGVIQVRCRVSGNEAVIDILDSPPAVPEEELPRVFERFHTGDAARNRTSSGSGLGLAICKTLTEAHGGNIRALPSPLGGLWMRLALPLGAA